MSIQEIQDQASTIYQNNLSYFEHNHPELFNTLVSLDFAIDANHYEERYALEYTDEGYFDVKELATELFLYGENSMDYAKRVVPNIDEIQTNKKVIFFGIGLGTHIPLIHKAIDAPATYLIVEDDLELFRVSLFVVDYAVLSENVQLVFSVMQTSEAFDITFERFYKIQHSLNDYIQYFIFSSRYMKKADNVKKLIEDLRVSLA